MPLAVFSHGLDSSPQSEKIRTLSPLAKQAGFDCHALDYREAENPQQRVEQLCRWLDEVTQPFVLIGSSLGAFVSIAASRHKTPAGLFLIAPAVHYPGYEEVDYSARCSGPIAIVHGWQDETCPVEGAIRFGREHDARLVLMPGDHLLHDQLQAVSHEFSGWLSRSNAHIEAAAAAA